VTSVIGTQSAEDGFKAPLSQAGHGGTVSQIVKAPDGQMKVVNAICIAFCVHGISSWIISRGLRGRSSSFLFF
jgi:hypothetical protein